MPRPNTLFEPADPHDEIAKMRTALLGANSLIWGLRQNLQLTHQLADHYRNRCEAYECYIAEHRKAGEPSFWSEDAP
jgi:hypothetical protein